LLKVFFKYFLDKLNGVIYRGCLLALRTFSRLSNVIVAHLLEVATFVAAKKSHGNLGEE
jgi:hypothetical protein